MNGENDIITIFIVAESAVARAGLESVVQANDKFVVTGSTAEISAVPSDFAAEQTVDVLLVGVERERDFNNLLEFLAGGQPEESNFPAVVALFSPELQNGEFAVAALQNNLRGVLPHNAAEDEITAAVAAAANGLITFLPETAESLLSFFQTADAPDSIIEINKQDFLPEMIESLTPRESEVLEMLAEGASNKSIAYQLNISEHTVKFHVASVFGKLGVNTRTEAVTQALRRGFVLL